MLVCHIARRKQEEKIKLGGRILFWNIFLNKKSGTCVSANSESSNDIRKKEKWYILKWQLYIPTRQKVLSFFLIQNKLKVADGT